MKLYSVKGKVKLVHLLLEDDIDPQRQEKSILSLSRLSGMGVEYIQVWNKRWTEEPPRENFTRPDMFDEVPITPGHYGAFRAFADGAIEHFTEDVDHFIMCEGDALLTVSPLEAVDQINKAIDGIKDNNISYFSFGSRYSLEDNILQSHTREQHGDVHVVSNIIGIQMIMFPNNIREYLIDRFKYATWDGADIFLTDIFVNKFKMGMLENSITTQASGLSAIEQRQRSFGKKKLVYLAPHLSTGGMPEFLLKRIQALQDQDEFEVHVVEYCLYANTFTVQRDQIKDLLGDRFHEIAHLNSIPQEVREARLIEIIESINPDVIHIEECPESFDSFNQMSYETQQSLYASHRPWKIVETCHNIWFNPKEGKRISPDAYAFVTPHHRLETFSEEPSNVQEILFPIVEQSVSDDLRRKSLEIFGFDADAEQYHLINIGLWTPGKNQGEAIEWARELEALQPGKFQFHFIGNQASNFAQYWQPLMQDLPANCHIHGERSDVETFYHMADAVVFNSTWECNPLTVRQSLGWPIPVMARNLPQYHDMYEGQLTEITGDITEDLLRLQRMLKGLKQNRNNEYTMARFKKEHLDLYLNTVKGPQKRKQNLKDFTITWDSGPKVSSNVGRELFVDFHIDGKSVYSHTLQGQNHWCKPAIQYYTDWQVYVDGKLVAETPAEGSIQVVQFDSSSLGDTLSWVEPAVAFKNEKGLDKLYVATHKNWLFDQDYYRDQGIEFIVPGQWPEDAVALWRVGVYMEDVGGQVWFQDKNKRDWRKIYLGDIASDSLGIGQVMKSPKLIYSGRTTQKRPYICIATASTAQAKYWNNEHGWQGLIDHYKGKGYDVYHVSKEETHLRGLKKAPEDLKDVYRLLQGAELFFGISSGLSWFAWATDVPVVLISGFTPEICEFDDEKTLRIINKKVCNSCWFDKHFDRGDWNWCPEHKGSERQFECTKEITTQDVVNAVEAWQLNVKEEVYETK
jgi:autotransporter strand-loop-strand O-heptosyltransferase